MQTLENLLPFHPGLRSRSCEEDVLWFPGRGSSLKLWSCAPGAAGLAEKILGKFPMGRCQGFWSLRALGTCCSETICAAGSGQCRSYLCCWGLPRRAHRNLEEKPLSSSVSSTSIVQANEREMFIRSMFIITEQVVKGKSGEERQRRSDLFIIGVPEEETTTNGRENVVRGVNPARTGIQQVIGVYYLCIYSVELNFSCTK